MSSFFARSALQLPIFSPTRRVRLWTHDCVLCLRDCGESLLCAACAAELEDPSPACPRCALPLARAELPCPACRSAPHAFDRAVARYEYRFPLDRLVLRFKYGGDLALGRWLAQRLAERASREPRPDVLVVPPLSPARIRTRGFNQALEIARLVGRRIGVAVSREALVRRHDTPSQASLGRRERQANLRGAFACTRALGGLHVAIVDDVLTTGATADAIAQVLKEAGAASVAVWAVARAPEPALP